VGSTAVQIAGRKNLRSCSPDARLDLSIFTEYISVEVYNQTPKNKLLSKVEKYLISGGTGLRSTSTDFLLF
jgi:hypothetical protein